MDALGDGATWVATPIALYCLIPALFLPELPLFVAGALTLALSGIVSLLKYGRVAIYHTWMAKAVAWLLSVGTGALILLDSGLTFRIGAALMIVMGIEELVITSTLKARLTDVPSIWHVLRRH